jgi:iron complex transport system substrate-binding protein
MMPPARCRKGLRLGAVALLAAAASVASSAATFVDDAGRAVSLERPPTRVVTLAPNLTEFVYAVGAGATLVGTVSLSDYPAQARSVQHIGDYRRFDLEQLLMLKPDLVLAWHHGNPGRELAQLEAAGLRLYRLEPRRLADVPRALERVGALLGHAEEGRRSAARLRGELEALRQRHADAATVSVFYQVWQNPLMTLNGQHIVSDVVELCGGHNLFAGLPQLVPQLSSESVVAADPEAILAARQLPGDTAGARRDPDDPLLAGWQRYPHLTAVRRGWLYTLPGDAITRQGPRIVEGARAVCSALDEVREERRARP